MSAPGDVEHSRGPLDSWLPCIESRVRSAQSYHEGWQRVQSDGFVGRADQRCRVHREHVRCARARWCGTPRMVTPVSAETIAIVGVGVALLAVLVPLLTVAANLGGDGSTPWPPTWPKCAAACMPLARGARIEGALTGPWRPTNVRTLGRSLTSGLQGVFGHRCRRATSKPGLFEN